MSLLRSGLAASVAMALFLAANPSQAGSGPQGGKQSAKTQVRHEPDGWRGHERSWAARGFYGHESGKRGYRIPRAHGPSEASLQQLMDREFGPGVLDAKDDRIADGSDSYWTAGNGASASLLFELSSNAPFNVFGIYDSTSPDARLPLFYGYAGSGATTSLSLVELATGGYRFTTTANGLSESALFGSSVFGFYLRTPGDKVFYSDSSLNPQGLDHLKAYAVDAPSLGEDFVWPDAYLFAWEDGHKGGDKDFNDMVLGVRGFTPAAAVAPVPLPAGIWLLGTGLLGLAGMVRRRAAGQKA